MNSKWGFGSFSFKKLSLYLNRDPRYLKSQTVVDMCQNEKNKFCWQFQWLGCGECSPRQRLQCFSFSQWKMSGHVHGIQSFGRTRHGPGMLTFSKIQLISEWLISYGYIKHAAAYKFVLLYFTLYLVFHFIQLMVNRNFELMTHCEQDGF